MLFGINVFVKCKYHGSKTKGYIFEGLFGISSKNESDQNGVGPNGAVQYFKIV